MTSQTLITNPSTKEADTAGTDVDSTKAVFSDDARQSRLLESMKAQYPLDQQVKFLHLQAETESLLQQLRAIKQKRDVSPM